MIIKTFLSLIQIFARNITYKIARNTRLGSDTIFCFGSVHYPVLFADASSDPCFFFDFMRFMVSTQRTFLCNLHIIHFTALDDPSCDWAGISETSWTFRVFVGYRWVDLIPLFKLPRRKFEPNRLFQQKLLGQNCCLRRQTAIPEKR